VSRTLIEQLDREPQLERVDDGLVVWQIDSFAREYEALRGGAGLVDLSGSGPLRVHGPGAADALNRALTRDLSFLAPEQTQTSLVLGPDGRPLDIVVVLAVAYEDYLVHCGPGRDGRVAEALRAVARPPGGPAVENLRDRMSVLAVEGPSSWRAVHEVLGEDYVALAYGSLLPAEVEGEEVLVARIGVTGEYGYTLFAPHGVAPRLWRALARHSTPAGHRALETAMFEVRQPVLHRELTEHSTVLSAGLNWLVDRTKEGFTGSVAVAAEAARDEGTRPIGFGVAQGVVEVGDELLVESESVGRVVHIVDSPGYGGRLGLAQVDRQWKAARLEFRTASGALVRTLAAPYVVPRSWTTPIEI